jgi:hypothetical protein
MSDSTDAKVERQLVGLPWAADSCPWVRKKYLKGGGAFRAGLMGLIRTNHEEARVNHEAPS